jgi:N-carbamoyl-L-amino-acid hydrolase
MSLVFYINGEITMAEDSGLKKIKINSQRLGKRIEDLSQIGKGKDGGVNRVAFSEADRQAREYILKLLKKIGLKTHIDEAGNIIGRKEGANSALPPIMFGSHIDTVPHGGKYDGALGVLGAIECVETMQENDIVTQHPLEVIIFTDEEGGLTGSCALVGKLTTETLAEDSLSGKTIREGISFLGGNPALVEKVTRKRGDIKAFVEIHIEQGRVLESKNIDIGIVEGIVGIKRWDITIKGRANHAGTTPMNMRQDALIGAAHLILEVNRIVTSIPGRQVGTVGCIEVKPGAPNVIPGQVIMSLELRDLSLKKIDSLLKQIRVKAQTIAEKSKVQISFDSVDVGATPALTDARLRKVIMESSRDLGLSYLVMPSGAGHDAQNMAQICPTGMIFIPSVGGISHSPLEFSKHEDVVNGVNVLLYALLKIDHDE